MSRNVIRIKKEIGAKSIFRHYFLSQKKGGGLSKMSANCPQGGGGKNANLAPADIWMTPRFIT